MRHAVDQFRAWTRTYDIEIIGTTAALCFIVDLHILGGILTVTMVFALGSKVMALLRDIHRSLAEIHRNFEEIHVGFGDIWRAIGTALEAAGRTGDPKGPWTCECGQANRPGRSDCALCDRPKP